MESILLCLRIQNVVHTLFIPDKTAGKITSVVK